MLLAGDEILHSQRGNNNCYCQDNELSWIDWSLTEKNADVLRFVQEMIALRKRHPAIMRRRFLTGEIANNKKLADVTWHGLEIDKPLWFDPDARLLAFTLTGIEADETDLHIIMNMSDEGTSVQLPLITGQKWAVALDTSQASPNDIISSEKQKAFKGNSAVVQAKSVVIFESITSKRPALLSLF